MAGARFLCVLRAAILLDRLCKQKGLQKPKMVTQSDARRDDQNRSQRGFYPWRRLLRRDRCRSMQSLQVLRVFHLRHFALSPRRLRTTIPMSPTAFGSNHAMERTATRCAFTFSVISKSVLRTTRALGGRRSSCLVRPYQHGAVQGKLDCSPSDHVVCVVLFCSFDRVLPAVLGSSDTSD